MTKNFHSTTRFSNRVENYVKYRPHYPKEILAFLISELGLKKESVIADIGSGTGISSELFVQNGNPVYGVEPNKAMRDAAERIFAQSENFISINGSAEATTLQDNSVDFVLSGQAFHWFDEVKSRKEFKRILKPQGLVLILWNERQNEASEFMKGYEVLLTRYGTDYRDVKEKNVDAAVLDRFFGENSYRAQVFHHFQEFNLEGLQGRLLSASYVPVKGDLTFETMIESLQSLFASHQTDGNVRMQYTANLCYGTLEQ